MDRAKYFSLRLSVGLIVALLPLFGCAATAQPDAIAETAGPAEQEAAAVEAEPVAVAEAAEPAEPAQNPRRFDVHAPVLDGRPGRGLLIS